MSEGDPARKEKYNHQLEMIGDRVRQTTFRYKEDKTYVIETPQVSWPAGRQF